MKPTMKKKCRWANAISKSLCGGYGTLEWWLGMFDPELRSEMTELVHKALAVRSETDWLDVPFRYRHGYMMPIGFNQTEP